MSNKSGLKNEKQKYKKEFLNNMLKDCWDNHLLFVPPNNYETNILKIGQLFISPNKHFQGTIKIIYWWWLNLMRHLSIHISLCIIEKNV